MLQHSDKLDQIGPALLKVQGEVGGVEKNANNPHFKSRYADLAATNAATRGALTEAGIHVSQWPGAYDRAENKMAMDTMFLHAASGQWMRAECEVPLSKADAQGYGSCVTYARRYALQAALGLSPEDDDGNAASRGHANSNGNGGTVSADQLQRLQDEADATGADLARFCKYMGVASLKDIPAAKFQIALDALAAKRRKDAA